MEAATPRDAAHSPGSRNDNEWVIGLKGTSIRFRALRALAAIFGLAAILLGFPGRLSAQMPGLTDNGAGNGANSQQQSPDCSDPLMASSPLCTESSGQRPVNPGFPGASSTQPRATNYTDLETYGPTGSAKPSQKLPPQPLTEFQKFVASTTGQVLPIFGAGLFDRVPSTFSPLNLSPVPPTYVLGPGDELRIRVWGDVNFSVDETVDRSGEIYLPQIGEVHVAGLAASSLDDHLRTAISQIYRNFHLMANLGQIRSIQVYVTGQARRPGVYTISALSTLVDAIFASGGPSIAGSLRDVQLRRAGRTVADFDLYGLLMRGDKSHDAPLQSGDVIYFPPVGPQVAITGSVHDPAIYELRPGESLSEAIADAGGASAVASETRISIERLDRHRTRYAMDVNWNAAGLATPLQDGDLVRLYSIVPMYQDTVTLRGNTANPGRFAWHPGMRLSDLIPDRASLITRNYWWRRAQLGLPAPEFQPFPELSTLHQPTAPEELPPNQVQGESPLNRSESQTSSAKSAPADAAAANSGSGAPNVSDTNAVDSGNANPPASQRAGSASLAAEYASHAPDQFQPRTTVGPIAPDIDWSYAVIERLDPRTLTTRLVPFDLGRLVLDHDPSQNLLLQPGDVVTIFSQADVRVPRAQQTKFVRLEGEFVHAGVYTVHPGETLRDLVRRAGGLTPDAYLYGSQFTRESTRALQQQRIDEYVQQLQIEMQQGMLAVAAAAGISPQAAAGSAAAQGSEQSLISRLQGIRATGRIVLQFNPHSHGLGQLPDIRLENGDRFVVPPVPASINVVGAVYDQNSFLYSPGMRAGEYLHLAGGPNRDADRKHMFIIRADGAVVSRAAANTLWGNQFDSLRMSPGDTIVVPEKIFRPSPLMGFLDWSQFFSQFALGAAAVKAVY